MQYSCRSNRMRTLGGGVKVNLTKVPNVAVVLSHVHCRGFPLLHLGRSAFRKGSRTQEASCQPVDHRTGMFPQQRYFNLTIDIDCRWRCPRRRLVSNIDQPAVTVEFFSTSKANYATALKA